MTIVNILFVLHGFVCAYHPEAPGSNPKHTTQAFSTCIIEIVIDIEMRK